MRFTISVEGDESKVREFAATALSKARELGLRIVCKMTSTSPEEAASLASGYPFDVVDRMFEEFERQIEEGFKEASRELDEVEKELEKKQRKQKKKRRWLPF